MTLREEIRRVSVGLDTPELLRFLIRERFPGKTVVTASLMASSVVVLKMVSDINPATPIIFCHRPPVFEESTEYRAKIVEHLGLKNVAMNNGRETKVRPGDKDHGDRMWVHYRDTPGRSLQILHLNDCLAPYSCWINAIYHVERPRGVRNRVDVEGRLIKVDPLIRWSKNDVRDFMSTHSLPYHKMAKRNYRYKETAEDAMHPTYHF